MSDETILSGNDEMLAAGSWVPAQGLAKDEGFRNVSAIWYPKTQSFEEGLELVAQQKANREDITFDVRRAAFDVTDKGITVDIDGRAFTPTDWAARQLCNWLKVPQTMWVHYKGGDSQDLELLADAFANGRRKYDTEKKLLFRTYKDGTLRGVMSDSYSIVDNDWYLETLQKFVPGGRLSHFRFSDADNFYGNILIPDTIRSESDSDYGGMLNCGNSAVGKRTVWQTPAIFRFICMNGCVWGAKKGIELRRRHRGIDLTEFTEAIRANIEKQIPLTTTKMSDLMQTRDMACVAPIVNIFAAIAKANNIRAEVLNKTAETWLGNDVGREKNAFGVWDAITRTGQMFDADTWESMDEIGGNILMGGQMGWDRLNAQAALFTDTDIKKVFGNTVAA
jgi:hypothetical protein